MKRPLVIATIGYTIGIIGGLYFSFCIVLFAVLFLLFLYMIAYFGKDMKIKKLKKSVILCLIFIILGSGIVSYQEKSYEESYNEEEIEVLGIVISSKKEKEYKDVYKIKVLRVGEDKSFYNKNIQLNVKKKKGQNQELEYGDLISFSGIYEKPSKSRNEYGFDYSMYLKSVKIYGDVTLEGDLKVIKKRQVPFFSLASYLFKEKVKSKIGILTKGKIKELFTGILIGDTQLLEKETKDYFKDSSLSHLLAVSGAHISYLVLGVTEFLNKMKIGKNYTKISICIILLFFMSVVGFTPSVTRAGIMGILVLLSGLFHRKNDVITSLCASLFFILLANPFSITNIGLQLSFGGTIGILAFQKKILSLFNRKEKIIEGFLKRE